MKKKICAFLCLSAVLLAGCGRSAIQPEETTAADVKETVITDNETEWTMTDFSIRLFQESATGSENTLLSPVSVLCALGMAGNGADNETLSQIENVIGTSIDNLNESMADYMDSLPNEDQYKLHIANSMWIKENVTINEDFAEKNTETYDAETFERIFDGTTLDEMNSWVSDNTEGKITNIVSDLPEDSMLYLVNALSFDAAWETVYSEDRVSTGTFTREDGTEQEAEFMSSKEGLYLSDEDSTGFVKYYADGSYAFAALLPDQGISMADYVDSLSGEKINSLFNSATDCEVDIKLPKFETESSVKMTSILQNMGMTDAFNPETADFSLMGEGDLYISNVLHKTMISVQERGTSAGASTAMTLPVTGMPDQVEEVTLDRPFLYMIMDTDSNTPIFIGTMMSLE